ncbi:mitochondria-eating protein isoform 1-T1 [Synchiropus picturatus]
MADTLRRLANTCSFSVMQDKLDSWSNDYHVASCDQNLNHCCELIELTARIQGQLFSILNLTANEAGHYGGVDTLKTRLLPWLGTCFSMARPSVSEDTSLQLIQDSVAKDRKIRELSDSHDCDMHRMETQLCSTRMQLDSVRAELDDAQKALDETKNKSATTLLATEEEILQLRADLQAAHDQLEIYKRKLDSVDEYERQICVLQDEVSFLTREKAMLQERLASSRSSSPLPTLKRSSSPARAEASTRAQLTNSCRYSRLVSRYSHLYAQDRLEAQVLLRRYVDDLEMVQKIIFIAVVESFKAAKLAYRQFKLRVRKTLSSTHFGPQSLEDVAVDYIVRNPDLYDVQTSINDVINAMNVNPRISFPPEVEFALITSIIRETCKCAFSMQTLDPPLDLAFASDGEIYNESKYRRSYDSDFSAPLVMYHVWPALMEGNIVVVKGEVVTRREASWGRSRSRSRSPSPARSRSLSPSRNLASKSKGRFSGSELQPRY